MNEEEIRARVATLYPDAIIDIAGENCSFEMFVIAEVFVGLNTMKRQQPILALFKDELASGKLHALSVKAKTPEEQAAGATSLVQIQL